MLNNDAFFPSFIYCMKFEVWFYNKLPFIILLLGYRPPLNIYSHWFDQTEDQIYYLQHAKHLVVSLPGKTCVACETGSGHVAHSKLSYTIQFSKPMLCAKYQEAGLCGS